MGMQFDGKEEALEREAARNAAAEAEKPKGRNGRRANKEAAKAEALSAGIEFDYDGKHYTLPRADQWDIDVFEALSEGDYILAAKVLLEPEQWHAFKTDDDGVKVKRTVSDLGDFLAVAMKRLGVEPGESNS